MTGPPAAAKSSRRRGKGKENGSTASASISAKPTEPSQAEAIRADKQAGPEADDTKTAEMPGHSPQLSLAEEQALQHAILQVGS